MIRYLGSDFLRSQRWAAPTVTYLVVVAISNWDRAPLLSTYAITSTILMLAAIWLTFLVLGCEDPVQEAITQTAVGSDRRLLAGKLTVAYLAAAALGGAAVIWPLVARSYQPPLAASPVLEGLGAHLVTALAGVGVGVFAQRLIRRLGWVVLFSAGIGLMEVLVPHCPPARDLLVLFEADHPRRITATIVTVAAETGAATVLLAYAAYLLPRRYR